MLAGVEPKAANPPINKMVAGINDIFEVEHPEDLVAGIEALVGLLRDCKQASNVDVELFMKDAKKLSNKFKRMESHGLKYENVKNHKAALEAALPKFVDRPKPPKGEYNIGPFKDLIDWGVQFATAAEMELRKENLEAEIA